MRCHRRCCGRCSLSLQVIPMAAMRVSRPMIVPPCPSARCIPGRLPRLRTSRGSRRSPRTRAAQLDSSHRRLRPVPPRVWSTRSRARVRPPGSRRRSLSLRCSLSPAAGGQPRRVCQRRVARRLPPLNGRRSLRRCRAARAARACAGRRCAAAHRIAAHGRRASLVDATRKNEAMRELPRSAGTQWATAMALGLVFVGASRATRAAARRRRCPRCVVRRGVGGTRVMAVRGRS